MSPHNRPKAARRICHIDRSPWFLSAVIINAATEAQEAPEPFLIR
jgi:hypothetical protein